MRNPVAGLLGERFGVRLFPEAGMSLPRRWMCEISVVSYHKYLRHRTVFPGTVPSLPYHLLCGGEHHLMGAFWSARDLNFTLWRNKLKKIVNRLKKITLFIYVCVSISVSVVEVSWSYEKDMLTICSIWCFFVAGPLQVVVCSALSLNIWKLQQPGPFNLCGLICKMRILT